VLDIHALHRADPAWEVEHFWFVERWCHVPPAVGLPDHWRVEALLDDLAENPFIKVDLGIVFIAIMTYISYRGIVISERIQAVLVSFQFLVLILMSVLALGRVFNGSAGP
jgi:amino acid transporter